MFFKDARAMDRQRTAASFDQGLAGYSKTAESWFDGSVGSIDHRIAQCDRLLHTAKFTVARVDIADSHRYLHAAEVLTADRRAMEALRSNLLTGGSDYAETHVAGVRVAGGSLENSPEAWDADGNVNPERVKWEKRRNDMANREEYNRQHNTSDVNSESEDIDRSLHVWSSDLGHGMRSAAKPPAQGKAPKPLTKSVQTPATVKPAVGGFDTAIKPTKVKKPPAIPAGGIKPPKPAGIKPLAGADQRWVTLESARFIAANANTLDDAHELAVRARDFAALKTSTFTPARSAAICREFVASVVELGSRSRPAARSAEPTLRTANIDFDPQMLFL